VGAEAEAKPVLEVGPAVPEWRSRGVLVRPGVGCTTPRDSAAAPINRDGARSGVVAIRRRQLQSLVVLARWGHQSETRAGRPTGPPRSGFLRVGGGVETVRAEAVCR
jgi:hypothetical protein